jgi:hypothetical protein
VNRSVVLARIAALAFVVTAALHSSAYRAVTALARSGPSELHPLVPTVWLCFSLALIILGLIIAANAKATPSAHRMMTLVFAGLFAFGSAALQLIYFGFIPPVAILCVDGALAIAAALLVPTTRT